MEEFLPMHNLVISWLLVSICVGIIACSGTTILLQIVVSCLDCSLFSIGTISANTNQGLYSTLSYIWHSLKRKYFWLHVSCKLVEEINIFRGNMCHVFSSLTESDFYLAVFVGSHAFLAIC